MGTVLLPQDAEGIPHLSLVSVPFSMGTVLLLVCRICIVCGLRPFQSPSRWGRCCFAAWVTRLPALRSFSPLLDGDGVASLDWPARAQAKSLVSVPFSMGTVLLRSASLRRRRGWADRFSPLLDGDGVASAGAVHRERAFIAFQSPSRWGRCCFPAHRRRRRSPRSRFSPLLDGDGVASEWIPGRR